VIAAGLLVGFGTRLGGGCTSGHGVCGIARLSPRSITATLVLMATAMVVVAGMRHGLGGSDADHPRGPRERPHLRLRPGDLRHDPADQGAGLPRRARP